MPLKIEPILEACLANAERLIESAKAVRSLPGCNHIAFNLVVLALEEIGKSILLFQESLDVKHFPRNGEEAKRPLEWIDDHERKLFWAIWFPLKSHCPIPVSNNPASKRTISFHKA